MLQYVYPSSDIDNLGWVRDPVGGDLYTAIDEAVLDLTDFVHVESQPFAGDPDFPYTFGIASASDPGTNANHVFELWVRMAGSGSHEMRFELLQHTGAGDAVVATRNILLSNPGVNEEKIIALTEGEISGITDYTNVRATVTLLSDTTSWTLDIFRARFGIPVVFAHLDISASGHVEIAAASGNYLELSGSGDIRKLGLEDVGTLVLPASGSGFNVRL